MTDPRLERNIVWHPSGVDRASRLSRGATLWFTGLSGSGKSTIASAVEVALLRVGRPAYVLDGDNVRLGLNGDLGFSADDRIENVRRVAHVAQFLADAGVVALVPVISPYRRARQYTRDIHSEAGLPFGEVWVSTPLEVCEQRDPKGLYAKARAGLITGFTGIDDAYEVPLQPDLELPAHELLPIEATAKVLQLLERLDAEQT